MDREVPGAVRLLLRVGAFVASEAELGDIAEEYTAGRHGALWVCRQLVSTAGRHSTETIMATGRPAMLSNIWRDVRYAARTFRRHPGYAAAAIAPIALGIGINTGVFSVLDAIALQPVASPNASELVTVYQQFQGVKERSIHGARAMFSTPEFRSYRDATRTLSGLMAFSRYWTVTLGGEAPREIGGALVSCNYFDVLQVRPLLGTGFTAANCDAPNPQPAVVLTHELWTRAFAADPAIASKTITLNGRTVAVAGVAPEGFDGIDIMKVSFFAPLTMQPVLRPQETYHLDPHASWLTLVGRLNPGATIAQVRADLGVIAAAVDREEPGRTTTLSVAPARALSIPQARRDIFTMATVLMGAFGLILLIACANVANLLLARAAGRSKEIAVRLSLGITRGRLVQQLLTESMLIAFAGAAAGSILARWSFQGLMAMLVSSMPGAVPSLRITGDVNLNVLTFALGVTVITGLVFGLAPALHASRLDLQALLNRDSAGGGRRASGWLRGSLLGVQAMVCTMLLISAGLLLRAVYAAETLEPGFSYRPVAMVSFDLRGAGLEGTRAAAFQDELLDRVRALPGVEAVAQVSRAPLSVGRSQTLVRVDGQPHWREIDFNTISSDYFRVLDIPIVAGRAFTRADVEGRTRTAIVSAATAQRYWPGANPIGRTLVMGLGPNQEAPLEIVGVVADAQVVHMGEGDSSYLYLPAGRDDSAGLGVLVRSRGDMAALAPAIRATTRELAPALVVTVKPLEENLSFWRTLSRLIAGLSGALSLLALMLASVGVYAVVSYVVSQRLREMGIRLMLGATGPDVRQLILRQTLRPVAIGILLGVGAAAGAGRVLQSVLFGVSPFDPAAFVGAPLLLLAVGVAASLAPTRQVLTRDPLATLRLE